MSKTNYKKQTPRQTKLIKSLITNIKDKGTTKTEAQLLIEAGYSPETAKNPKMIIQSPAIQQGIKPYLARLDEKRRKSLDFMTDNKLIKSNARDLAYINDILTKNHQLLGGNPTQRLTITPEQQKEVDEAFKSNT